MLTCHKHIHLYASFSSSQSILAPDLAPDCQDASSEAPPFRPLKAQNYRRFGDRIFGETWLARTAARSITACTAKDQRRLHGAPRWWIFSLGIGIAYTSHMPALSPISSFPLWRKIKKSGAPLSNANLLFFYEF